MKCISEPFLLVQLGASYMVDGVHGNTTSLWPRVALDGELMLRTRGLEERLVGSATTSDNTNHATDGALDNLLRAGWELDTSLALVWVVANDGDVVSRRSSKRASVANLLLHVGHDSTLRNGAEWEDVADGERGVLAGVDELTSVHALVGDEGLGVQLVSVWVAEDDLGERGATACIVDNLLHDTADVAMALGEIVGSELRRSLVEALKMQLVSDGVSNRGGSLVRVLAVKMEPRPFLWLRMTRP